MLLGTLSAPKRGQMGSKALTLTRGTPTFGTFWAENVAPRPHYGPIWDLKWRPKRGSETKLALGSSKNEVLGVVLENVRNLMELLCENA